MNQSEATQILDNLFQKSNQAESRYKALTQHTSSDGIESDVSPALLSQFKENIEYCIKLRNWYNMAGDHDEHVYYINRFIDSLEKIIANNENTDTAQVFNTLDKLYNETLTSQKHISTIFEANRLNDINEKLLLVEEKYQSGEFTQEKAKRHVLKCYQAFAQINTQFFTTDEQLETYKSIKSLFASYAPIFDIESFKDVDAPSADLDINEDLISASEDNLDSLNAYMDKVEEYVEKHNTSTPIDPNLVRVYKDIIETLNQREVDLKTLSEIVPLFEKRTEEYCSTKQVVSNTAQDDTSEISELGNSCHNSIANTTSQVTAKNYDYIISSLQRQIASTKNIFADQNGNIATAGIMHLVSISRISNIFSTQELSAKEPTQTQGVNNDIYNSCRDVFTILSQNINQSDL